MADYFAPVTEGFTDMDLIFKNILKVNPVTQTKTAMTMSPTMTTGSPTAFLREMLDDKKATVTSLMDTAKKISPASQTIVALETAYDAAFESEVAAPLPNSSATLQGFTLIFFVVSFFSLALVTSVYINNVTGNTSDAMKTFGVFTVIFFILFGLVTRFG
jgi:hypothetical protein